MKDIVNIVANEKFEDIITVGYSYLKNSQYFYFPISEILYIKFSNSYIKCTWVFQENKIELEIVNFIKFDYIKLDDSSYCISSIGKLILTPFSYNSFINKIDIIFNDHCKPDANLVSCIGFQLRENDYFFLDSSYSDGFLIRKEIDIVKWMDNFYFLDKSYKTSFWLKGSESFIERKVEK